MLRIRGIRVGILRGRQRGRPAAHGAGALAWSGAEQGHAAAAVRDAVERNTLTDARLEAAGIGVTRVPGGELAGCRGGPGPSAARPAGPAVMPGPMAG